MAQEDGLSEGAHGGLCASKKPLVCCGKPRRTVHKVVVLQRDAAAIATVRLGPAARPSRAAVVLGASGLVDEDGQLRHVKVLMPRAATEDARKAVGESGRTSGRPEERRARGLKPRKLHHLRALHQQWRPCRAQCVCSGVLRGGRVRSQLALGGVPRGR